MSVIPIRHGVSDAEPESVIEGQDLRFWYTRASQLEHALQSRIVIEQAKGVLGERYRLTPDNAFDLLRRSARRHSMNLHVLAAEVVASRQTPIEIEGTLVVQDATGVDHR